MTEPEEPKEAPKEVPKVEKKKKENPVEEAQKILEEIRNTKITHDDLKETVEKAEILKAELMVSGKADAGTPTVTPDKAQVIRDRVNEKLKNTGLSIP